MIFLLRSSDDVNVFEAAANGAAVAGKTVATVGGCYIAFLSMLAFVNATLSYIGARVGHPELSFEVTLNNHTPSIRASVASSLCAHSLPRAAEFRPDPRNLGF